MELPKDKMAIIQVLGDLINNPLLILDESYRFEKEDFPERFHQILFGTVENLVKSGVKEINFNTVDDYLSKYPVQYKVFTDNHGDEYMENAIQIADSKNFPYYYATVRKFGLLRQLAQKGFDTSEIYNPNILDVDESSKMQRKFDNLTTEDILNAYEQSIIGLKEVYVTDSVSTGCQAGKGIKDLKEQYKSTPEMGMPLGSHKLTTICRGRRLKKLYLKTAPSGFGKTRISAGDAAKISIPIYYDTKVHQWVSTGCKEPTLFITTELEKDEVQTMFLAYVSGVPEDHILDGKYEDGEEERVDRAIEVINESPLWIEHCPDFNVEDIENIIKRYKTERQIGYVFFDYLFTSIKILSEVSQKARGVKIREDNVLIMFVDKMKTLCNSLNIHIDTSTQANGDWKTTKDGDANIIRGAKGIADKLDIAYCVLPFTAADDKGTEAITHKGFSKKPNLVYHVYKVRRGRINHVKVFVYFDYSTCRTEDLFVTDNDYKLLQVEGTDCIEEILNKTEEKKKDAVEEEAKDDDWF